MRTYKYISQKLVKAVAVL